jgi:membrane protease YdiL (CAAX protease family)
MEPVLVDDAERQVQGAHRGFVLLAILCEGGLAALAFALAYWWEIPLRTSFSFGAWDVLVGMLASIPMLAGFFICVRWPIGPLKGIQQFCREIVGPLFRRCAWYELAGIALLAGIGEETLFRGVLQVAVGRWLGVTAALGAVSILFGLLHLITPAYGAIAALMGCYLGCLFLMTGSLIAPTAAHALYDFLALVYLVKAASASTNS